MSNRMDAMVARKNGERTFWTKIGVAFEGERGWKVTLDALPIPDDRGQVTMFLFPPKPKDNDDSSPWE